MNKKLKILAAGDLHGSFAVAEKLSKKAREENVDLIVLAGDIYDYYGGDPKILDVFKKANQKVFFIPGNCDFDEESFELKKRAKCIHNYYVTYDGVGIAGFGNPNWKLQLDKNDFKKINKNLKDMKTDKKIFVSHLHPAGTNAEGVGLFDWGGDQILRIAIEKLQPDLVIAAHIHEAEGLEDIIGKTKVVQVGKTGKVIEI